MSQSQKNLLETKSEQLYQYLHEIFKDVPIKQAFELNSHSIVNSSVLFICYVNNQYYFIYRQRAYGLVKKAIAVTNKVYTIYTSGIYRGISSLNITNSQVPVKFIKVDLPNIFFVDGERSQTPDKEISFDFNDRLFNIFFEKSQSYNEYYNCFNSAGVDMTTIPFPEKVSLYAEFDKFYSIFIKNFCTPYDSQFVELVGKLIFSKYFKKKSKKRINCQNQVVFKTMDRRLSPEVQKGKFTIEKYVPKQGGKVYLVNKKTDQKLITKIKHLKNVFRKNQKKDNLKPASFSYEVP